VRGNVNMKLHNKKGKYVYKKGDRWERYDILSFEEVVLRIKEGLAWLKKRFWAIFLIGIPIIYLIGSIYIMLHDFGVI
jgi:hypothetical protein